MDQIRMLNLLLYVLTILHSNPLGYASDLRCYPNQTIHFANPNTAIYTNYLAVYDDGTLTECEAIAYNDNADIHFNCASTTATVTVYFSDRSISMNEQILRGNSTFAYKFQCTSINPYTASVTDDLNVSVNETTESATPEYGITVSFCDAAGNEITEAQVGDTVNFVITAPAEYSLLGKSCIATGENNESALLTTNGCSHDPSLISDFSGSIVKLNLKYSADFYVFKFYNSDSVTIECLLKVCPGSGDCTGDSCDERRKKHTITDDEEAADKDKIGMSTVKRRLQIVERALGGSMGIYGSVTLTVLMIVLMYVTRN